MTEKELFKDSKAMKIFAVSGGPDSMYMLDLYTKKFDPKTILVAHVNYNFRNDSLIDQNLVEHFCEKHELKLEVKVVDQEMYQSLAQNFEDFARNLRYDFFESLAKKYKSKVVFVAHTQNDLVETFLLQKERKNLVNYYGLDKLTERKDLWIYRPLLNLKKSFILEQNEINRVPYHLDSTNFDEHYARNKIRANLKETEFNKYLAQIKKMNKTLAKEDGQIQKYLKSNINGNTLKVKKEFFSFDQTVKQRIVYGFFEQTDQLELFLNRKKQTVSEVVKLIDNQLKPILQLSLKEAVIVKDFDELYVVKPDFFKVKVLKLKSFNDLKKIKDKKLEAQVKKMIVGDHENWPYQLTNDYEDYKNWSYVKTKRTNRYFINQKIKLKNRVAVFALINNDNQVINIKNFFKLWDN